MCVRVLTLRQQQIMRWLSPSCGITASECMLSSGATVYNKSCWLRFPRIFGLTMGKVFFFFLPTSWLLVTGSPWPPGDAGGGWGQVLGWPLSISSLAVGQQHIVKCVLKSRKKTLSHCPCFASVTESNINCLVECVIISGAGTCKFTLTSRSVYRATSSLQEKHCDSSYVVVAVGLLKAIL